MVKIYHKRIKKEGNKFYFETFYPKHEYKYMGKLVSFNDTKVFIIHIKKPEIHFYIKGQGYPINEELLKMLHNAGIEYIVIPEQGKTGFKTYLANIGDYLKGDLIHEPHTEAQRVIILRTLKEIDIPKDKLEKMLYL